jgi:hypothetical protein
MTTDRHLERDLPAILGEIAMGRYPEYIDDVLATTAQRRQRPGWTFPERWLPVELVKSRAPVARLPWRQIGVLAIIAVLLAAMLAAFVGSRQQRLPPPFGVTANGLVAYVQGGDIYTADPITGLEKAVVTGPETDLRPIWSLDGTRVVFERKVNGDTGPGWLFVANQDGRGLIRVTPEPLLGLVDYTFSPDGRAIVSFAQGERGPAFMVIATDGTGQPKFFYVGATSEDGAVRYRPDGSEIMFIGRKPGAGYRDLKALDPATGNVRSIVEGSVSGDIHAASWSPDGTHIAYAKFDQNATTRSSRTHVVNPDGTGDGAVDISPDSIADGGSNWSNDGTRLEITRFYPGGTDDFARTAIVPIDRSSVGVEIECPPGATPADCTADWIWSPDDSVLLGARSDASHQPLPQFMADPLTGKIHPAPWTATGPPAWQRVAR